MAEVMCEQRCGAKATVYAMGRGAGDWGGRYCEPCAKALDFIITDRLLVIDRRAELQDRRRDQIGRRVRLSHTDDPHTDLQPGAKGTVSSIDDAGTLFVDWDDGSHLGLIEGADQWTFL